MPRVVIPVNIITHRANRRLIDKSVEHGGTLRLNRTRTEFVIDNRVHSTEYDSLRLPRGIAHFHSHPRKCTRDRCALGIPSARDICSFILAASETALIAHFIYTKEGTYVLSLSRRTKGRFRSRNSQRSLFMRLNNKFNSLKHLPYAQLCRRWKSYVRTQGVKIRLFRGNRIPSLVMR